MKTPTGKFPSALFLYLVVLFCKPEKAVLIFFDFLFQQFNKKFLLFIAVHISLDCLPRRIAQFVVANVIVVK